MRPTQRPRFPAGQTHHQQDAKPMKFSLDELYTVLSLVESEQDSIRRSLERPNNKRPGATNERLCRRNWHLIGLKDKLAAEIDR
jgi:hypothetical protein